MNYLEIVLLGYFNENNREFLEKYFFREFKKAEKNDFEANEFFNGCLKIIKKWEDYLQEMVFERKKELQLMLYKSKKGTLTYNDLEGKTVKQNHGETIAFCEQELKDVRPDGIGSFSFTVPLFSLTNGRVSYNMTYDEIMQIKISILKAFQKAQNNIEASPFQPTESEEGQEQESENDLTLSIIEDWLFDFKKLMSETDYNNLVSALIIYFDTGTFPKLSKAVQIQGRPNKKLLGWALNRICEAKGKGVEKELLLFAKQYISLFADVQFDENNIQKSNLYKYFTTKTK